MKSERTEKLAKWSKTVIPAAMAAAAFLTTGDPTAGTVLAGAVAGIGGNLLSNQVEAGLEKVEDLFTSSPDGLLNHNIQRALAQAFDNAVAALETAYFKTNAAQNLAPEKKDAIANLLQKLRECPEQYFLAASEEQIADWLYGDNRAALADLLRRIDARRIFNMDHEVYGDDFRRFFENHLIKQVQFWFFEYLKVDQPENTKAWRAFQRLMLEIVQLNQHALYGETQAVKAQLAQIQTTLDNLRDSPRQNDEPFADGLNAVLEQLRGELQIIGADVREVKQEVKDFRAEAQLNFQDVQGQLRRIVGLLQYGGFVTEGVEPISVEAKNRFIPLINRHIELFAGRERELEQIEEFLTTRAKGYIFITAPSGYGKTALLANLVNRQKDRYCYHFLSQLDKTEEETLLLRNLGAQICRYYGIGGELPREPEKLRALYSSLLDMAVAQPGKPLIVVLDGVDEAAYISDLHIPRKLPEGTFIIFSARQTGRAYLEELGLPADQVCAIELTGLDAPGIRGLLQCAGDRAAAFASDEQRVGALLAISGGDPFYLHFLGQDIKSGAVTSDNVAQMPTRLNEYLDRQFEQLRRSLTPAAAAAQKDLLGFLLVAKDKLTQADVMALTQIDEWDFDDVVNPLRRFLIQTETAYTLCHPRFADYFRAKLRQTVTHYAVQLRVYCADWQTHRSPYALAYLPEHLREAKEYAALFALANDLAFRQAQIQAFPDDPHAPLRTIQTALQGAADEDNPVKMAELLLAHDRQVIEITQENPLEALRNVNLKRAWELADLYDIEPCIQWYLLLTWELQDTKRLEEARETLNRLRQKALPSLVDHSSGSKTGKNVAYLLVQIDTVDKEVITELSQRLIGIGDDDSYKSMCFALIEQQRFSEAITYAQQIKNECIESKVLGEIALAQALRGEQGAARTTFATALSVAKKIEGYRQAYWLREIVIAQWQAGEHETTQATLSIGLIAAQQDKNEKLRDLILTEIAATQAYLGNFDSALMITQQIQSESNKATAISEIATAQAYLMDIDTALGTAQQIGEKWLYTYDGWKVLINIAFIYAQHKEFVLALTTAQRIKWKLGYVKVLRKITDVLMNTEKHNAARKAFNIALMTAQQEASVNNNNDVDLLIEIAMGLSQLEEYTSARTTFAKALAIQQKTVKKETFIKTLITLASAQANAGYFDAALTTTQAIKTRSESETNYWRNEAFIAIATAQKQVGHFSGALATAQQITDQKQQLEIFQAIVIAQIETNEFAAALITIDQVWQLKGREWGERVGDLLVKVGVAQAQFGDLSGALKTSDRIYDSSKRQKVLHAIVLAQIATNDLAAAMITAGNTCSQEAIALAQAYAGDFEGAMATATRIYWEPDHAETLGMIALAQAQAGKQEAAQATFAIALSMAQQLAPNECYRDYVRAKALRSIAVAQAQAGEREAAHETFSLALHTARQIQEVDACARELMETGLAQCQVGEYKKARKIFAETTKIVEKMETDWRQAELL